MLQRKRELITGIISYEEGKQRRCEVPYPWEAPFHMGETSQSTGNRDSPTYFANATNYPDRNQDPQKNYHWISIACHSHYHHSKNRWIPSSQVHRFLFLPYGPCIIDFLIRASDSKDGKNTNRRIDSTQKWFFSSESSRRKELEMFCKIKKKGEDERSTWC